MIAGSRPGFAAAELAGEVEQPDGPAVGEQVDVEYQHGDELLVRGGMQFGGVPVAVV